jgi:hypothetical protein
MPTDGRCPTPGLGVDTSLSRKSRGTCVDERKRKQQNRSSRPSEHSDLVATLQGAALSRRLGACAAFWCPRACAPSSPRRTGQSYCAWAHGHAKRSAATVSEAGSSSSCRRWSMSSVTVAFVHPARPRLVNFCSCDGRPAVEQGPKSCFEIGNVKCTVPISSGPCVPV